MTVSTQRCGLALIMTSLVASCGPAPMGPPAGQVLLYVDTDAPVIRVTPSGAPRPAATDPMPLFDQLRIDVYPPGSGTPCAGCSNVFAVDAAAFEARRVSVGVVPASGSRARVRLTNSAFALSGGEPDPSGSLDTIIALPPVGADGIVEISVMLSTEDVGRTVGTLDLPLAATAGRPAASAVGTWPDGARVPCASDPAPGEVCVPGGAFWMGPRGDYVVVGTLLGWHRLVVVSPFFLGATEVTVAEARKGNLVASPWSGSTAGDSLGDWCTFTPSPGPRDRYPVNCMLQSGAAEFCRARGSALPTEAQLEYVMGALQDHRYLWGDDSPESCDDMVWGRNGFGIQTFEPQTCLAFSTLHDSAGRPIGGPSPPGSTKRDALVLPTGTLLDLAGNLNEWAADDYAEQSDGCWTGDGVLRDPLCRSSTAKTVLRGGAWTFGGSQAEASGRQVSPADLAQVTGGFRCARSGL